jgi:predicted transcriptional regulator
MYNRKLDMPQVRYIRRIYSDPKANYSVRDLASMYGVSRKTIQNIINNRTYPERPNGSTT